MAIDKHQINSCYQRLDRAFFTSKFPEKEIDRVLKKYGERIVDRASLLLWDKITKGSRRTAVDNSESNSPSASSPLDIVDRLKHSQNKEELTRVKNFYKDEFLWVWLFFVSDDFKKRIVEIAKQNEELINAS
ncbi:MAG: hypothetical protein ACRDBG_04470 [Waterburya sp.]